MSFQCLPRRTFLTGAAATAVLAVGAPPVAAQATGSPATATRGLGSEIATDWVRTLYDVVMAEGLTPPAAARFYFYTSVAMYETAVPGMRFHHSLAGEVTDLRRPTTIGHRVDWPSSISTAVSTVALGLLPNASTGSVEKIRSHAAAVVSHQTSVVGEPTVRRSVRHGERVAAHLLRWMAEDGYDVASSLPYTPPVGEGLWRSTPPNFGTAIEPHWALVRPAALRTADEVAPIPPVEFSSEVGSEFYEEAMVTYRQSFVNTEDQITIARFWTDNPRLSGLPSGHWFLLLSQLADEDLDLNLDDTLDAMVLLGAALHDAFLNCWTWKYRYNLIRPVSYIQDHIDSNWATLVNTPQFPEYTSGHSVGSGAAEYVLTSLFGEFAFEDKTGVPRGFVPRSFRSFAHAADEAASSRLYGGIHYPMGISNGLSEGREVGKLVEARLRNRRRRR